MRARTPAILLIGLAIPSLTLATVGGQTPEASSATNATAATAASSALRRTPWGDPESGGDAPKRRRIGAPGIAHHTQRAGTDDSDQRQQQLPDPPEHGLRGDVRRAE